MDKRIEIIELPVSELKTEFGNPRKPLKKKAKEKLKESLDNLGDFGVIVIDEHNNIISGHQRVSILMENPDTQVLCKRLIGYSESELKAINIKANTHAGEWDMDKLELIRYEKYDYVMIVCRNEIDHLNLTRALGIDDKKVLVSRNATRERKIKARAVWYDDIKAQIMPKKEKEQ